MERSRSFDTHTKDRMVGAMGWTVLPLPQFMCEILNPPNVTVFEDRPWQVMRII